MLSRGQFFPTYFIDSIHPNQNPESYFVVIDKLTLKFIWRSKRPRIANSIVKEKNEIRGLTLLDFKTYSNSTIIKTV